MYVSLQSKWVNIVPPSPFDCIAYEVACLLYSANGLLPALSLPVEAPVGVGFSYSLTKSEYITNDTKTASDNFVFVQKWLQAFPEYEANELYITWVATTSHHNWWLE